MLPSSLTVLSKKYFTLYRALKFVKCFKMKEVII